MALEYTTQVRGNLSCAIGLSTVEADDVPIFDEQRGKALRVALVPPIEQLVVQIAHGVGIRVSGHDHTVGRWVGLEATPGDAHAKGLPFRVKRAGPCSCDRFS